jgi:hypothetical protein
MKKMDPMDAMKEANKVLKKEGKYKNLQEKDVERIMEDTNDFIFGRDIPEDPEGFAKGGTVSNGLDYLSGIERRGYAGGSGPKIPGKLGKIVSMAERLWQGARRTGDTKYDAQMVAEEIAETLFKKDFYDLPQAKQMELYRAAYDNAPRPPVRSASPKGGIIDISDPETASDFANFAKQNDPEGYKKIEDMVNEINQKREATKGMSLEDEMNMVLNQYDKSMFIKNEQGMVDVANPENIQKMALLLQKDHPNLYKKLQEQASQVDTIENFDITGRKPNAEGGLQGLNYLTGL